MRGGDGVFGQEPPNKVARASRGGSPPLGRARGCSRRRAGRMVVGLVRALVGLVRVAGMVEVVDRLWWLVWDYPVHGVFCLSTWLTRYSFLDFGRSASGGLGSIWNGVCFRAVE